MDTTLRVLNEQCENIQNDLLCILDGMDGKVLDDVCQVIVDRFNFILNVHNDTIRYRQEVLNEKIAELKDEINLLEHQIDKEIKHGKTTQDQTIEP